MSTLQQTFQEFSIIWLVISAGVGGIIGALIKFLFEEILQTRYRYSVNSRKVLKKYTYPILRAADTLDKRLENLIRFSNKNWFDKSEQDYYKISTLYIFGCYIGWCKILEDEAFIEYEMSNKKARDFSIRFNTVFKSLTNFSYFQTSNIDTLAIQEATPPRFTLTAIGELMIKCNEKENKKEIIDFIEFSRQYNTSDEFKRWFFFVERMFSDLTTSIDDAKWNRVLIFAANIRALVIFLDKSSRQTAPRKITFLENLHPSVSIVVRKELTSLGMSSKITNEPFLFNAETPFPVKQKT
ncbi:hypothetical protein EYB53_013435 [Candidatus Chloroploca sp. M-50]|uniref:Uncharacterized protein n=1 Tax=Candidatus Chloroploca mongolica TaxID=2528176 RepID=A0ABS4DB93_9CHLR|nr:hypothetical protein [Candidatus Chloroploca mongolica]MBP1466713.1 hypothetical protein [Candidatus Chloroploca mongolica]